MVTDATKTKTEADLAAEREADRKRREAQNEANPFSKLFSGGGIFAFLGKIFQALLGGGGLGGLFSSVTKSVSSSFSDLTDGISGRGDTPLAPKGSTPKQGIAAKIGSGLRAGWEGVLDLIGQHESGGDYNRVYGKGVKRMDLTNMSIDQVIAWQKSYTQNEGSASSAAGKYQIIRKTLTGLKDQMGLTGNEKFDQAMQDRMAMKLLENRGIGKLKAETMTTSQIQKAVNSVSKEWASIEGSNGKGAYDNDGLNHAARGTGQKMALAIQSAVQNESGRTSVARSVDTQVAATNETSYSKPSKNLSAAPVLTKVASVGKGASNDEVTNRQVMTVGNGAAMFIGNYDTSPKETKVASTPPAPVAQRTTSSEGGKTVFSGTYDGSVPTQIAAITPAKKVDANLNSAMSLALHT